MPITSSKSPTNSKTLKSQFKVGDVVKFKVGRGFGTATVVTVDATGEDVRYQLQATSKTLFWRGAGSVTAA